MEFTNCASNREKLFHMGNDDIFYGRFLYKIVYLVSLLKFCCKTLCDISFCLFRLKNKVNQGPNLNHLLKNSTNNKGNLYNIFARVSSKSPRGVFKKMTLRKLSISYVCKIFRKTNISSIWYAHVCMWGKFCVHTKWIIPCDNNDCFLIRKLKTLFTSFWSWTRENKWIFSGKLQPSQVVYVSHCGSYKRFIYKTKSLRENVCWCLRHLVATGLSSWITSFQDLNVKY